MRFLRNWLKKRHKPPPLFELSVEVSEFFEAIYDGDTEAVRRSLEQGISANETSHGGRDALFEALLQGYTEIACLLLTYGAHPNGISEIQTTPLSLAVSRQDIVSIHALLKHGADVNHGVDAEGSVLHTAARRGNIEIVRLLLDHQIDVDLTDEGGENALQHARLCWDHWQTDPRAEIIHILERA